MDCLGRQSGGAAKMGVITGKMGMLWGHQASHDFLGRPNCSLSRVCADNPHYASACYAYHPSQVSVSVNVFVFVCTCSSVMLSKSSCDYPPPPPIIVIVAIVISAVGIVCIPIIVFFGLRAWKKKQGTKNKKQIAGSQQEPKKKEVEGTQEERKELKT